MRLFIWDADVLNGGYSDGFIVVLAPDLETARELALGDCPKLRYESGFKEPNRVVDLDAPDLASEAWIVEGGQ